MTLPARAQVGPYVYAIHEVHTLADGSWAMILWESRTIQIKASLDPIMKRMALWHEIKHACNEIVGKDRGKFTEEEYTHCAAPLELDTLRTNPDLVTYLLEEA